MRAWWLLTVLLVPTAAAWVLDLRAPQVAASGLPFAVEACVEGPAGALVELRVDTPRYGAPFALDDAGRACLDVELAPGDVEGTLDIDARVRPAGGAMKASDSARVELRRVGIRIEDGPRVVPALDGDAQGRLRIVEVRAAPFAGVVLENAGPGEARLGGLTLAGIALPDARLTEDERVFVGVRAPPDVARVLALPLAPARGNMTLRAHALVLDSFAVPTFRAGQVVDADGARPQGRTREAATRMQVAGALVAFATPDAGAAPLVDLVDSAQREVLVEAYTMTSPELGAALGRALDRGVTVRVLLEGAPVGGVPPDERGLVAALVARGANVSFLASDPSFPTRYATLHAKLLVVDREAVLVSTENLHASSFPPTPSNVGTRGFGLVIHNASLAQRFAAVMDADAAPWPDVRAADLDLLPPPVELAARASTPGRALALEGAWNVTPIFSPDASLALAEALASAQRRIDVAMLFVEPRFGAAPDPFLEALVDAARRNVTVRLLLDGNVDEGRNRAVVARLDALARREGLPLEARLDAFDRTLHAKLVLLDERAAYVGSMNWGNASATRNREAGLILESEEVALWWMEVFEEEWGGPAPQERREVDAASVLVVVLVLTFAARRWRA